MLKNNGPSSSSEVLSPGGASGGGNPHWSHERTCRTVCLLRRKTEDLERLERVLDQVVGGGSEHGQLILLHPFPTSEDYKSWLRVVDSNQQEQDWSSASNKTSVVLLDVDGHQVSGFTRKDLLAWFTHCLLRASDDAIHAGVQLVTAPITGQQSFVYL